MITSNTRTCSLVVQPGKRISKIYVKEKKSDIWASPVAQTETASGQETWIQSLGQEDPLEKAIATHSSILAWRIPWTEMLGELHSMKLQRVEHNWATNFHFHQ